MLLVYTLDLCSLGGSGLAKISCTGEESIVPQKNV